MARSGRTGVGPEPVATGSGGGYADGRESYAEGGLITDGGGPVPFVGSISYLAGATPDSTILFLALSLADRALSFTRQGDLYRSAYEVRLDLRRDGTVIRHVATTQSVRVSTYREAVRTDETVIFEQPLRVSPGFYVLSIALRDASMPHWDTRDVPVEVPELGEGSLATPVAIYSGNPRPSADSNLSIVARPRATAVVGRDTAIELYLEAYGDGPSVPISLSVRSGICCGSGTNSLGADPSSANAPAVAQEPTGGGRGVLLWADTISLPRRGSIFSGTAMVPVSRIGIGNVSVVAARLPQSRSVSKASGVSRPDSAARDGGAASLDADRIRTRSDEDIEGDTRTVPVFVSLGDDLPLASFDDMLAYLKYLPLERELSAVRHAPLDHRSAAWAAFLRAADSLPSVPPHEALRTYLDRLHQANEHYRDEGIAGWRTDRGMVFISLGNPDQIDVGTQDISHRQRVEEWVYRQYSVRLTFADPTGIGHWRLVARSLADFEAVVARSRYFSP